MKMKLLLTMVCASLFFAGCNPNDDEETPKSTNPTTNFSENFGASVTRDFIGQIVDTDNRPVASATVKIGSSSAQTDNNGVFIINGADVHENFAYITATKLGYVDGSRALVPTTGKNSIRIMMLPLEITQTIASGMNSSIAYAGIKVDFDGAFEDASGNAYSGDVNVSMYHLKPSNSDLDAIMPGMLYAEDASGQEKVLETFGMMHVELRGTGGQKLQLASGHTAQITLEIDNTQTASAPATIPLWHFDKENGYWKEDGVATRQGNKYVGTVSHFSWWNCDAPFATVALSLTAVDVDGNPLPGLMIELTQSGYLYGRTAITDSYGHASGLIPANVTLTMNIYVYGVCGDQSIQTSTIGPFATDTVLPDIVVSNPQVESVMVQGNLVKCDNTDVTNGYVMFKTGTQYNVAPVTTGDFSFSTLVCSSSNTFTLTGLDYDTLQSTDSLNYSFTAPITHVGNIQACNAISEYITYQVDANPPVYLVLGVQGIANSIDGTYFSLSAYNQNQNGMYISANVITPGIYSTNEFSIESSMLPYIWSGLSNTMVFNVSQVGNVGEYIDMTFYGTYSDAAAVTHTLVGNAHVKRDQ